MSGEKKLDILLKSMSPVLMDDEYIFSTFQDAQYGDYSELKPVAVVCESEGLTLVIPKSKADDNNISYSSVFRGITLSIHSSLDAVGLTAAFSTKLAQHGISANVIAGFFHDHIFVQSDVAEKAIEALGEFSQ